MAGGGAAGVQRDAAGDGCFTPGLGGRCARGVQRERLRSYSGAGSRTPLLLGAVSRVLRFILRVHFRHLVPQDPMNPSLSMALGVTRERFRRDSDGNRQPMIGQLRHRLKRPMPRQPTRTVLPPAPGRCSGRGCIHGLRCRRSYRLGRAQMSQNRPLGGPRGPPLHRS